MHFCYVRNQCLIIRLPKEIDHRQAEKIRQECEASCMHFLIRDIIFDFSRTVFMDSSGIGLILGRVRKSSPVNGRVYLFGGNEIIKRMWEMSGVTGLVTVLDDIEELKEVYE
ncbi:MAG: STAS domain-containing protein [Eubacterium sp.]|nr:STAS domain-containing protein [Eubacterium sp.]MDD7209990.1 anti-sigma factor antagonist [Lachnospiraceae bacterium]MDY5496538.1 anti-sigma factor antagonist [Anaerobutyricum sp.]